MTSGRVWVRASCLFWKGLDGYCKSVGINRNCRSTTFSRWLEMFTGIDGWELLVFIDEGVTKDSTQKRFIISDRDSRSWELAVANLEDKLDLLVDAKKLTIEQRIERRANLKSRLVKAVFAHGWVNRWV